MKIEYFFPPFIIALIATPLLKLLADKLQLYARTNQRTIHSRKIARIGGVAIYLAFVVTVLLMFELDKMVIGMLVGGSIIFFTGLIDDIHEVNAFVKLFMQVVAAMVVIYIGGVSLDRFNLPFGLVITNHFILDVITFVWIIGVINAINIIDGLDGLAAGICLIGLVTLLIIGLVFSGVSALPFALILAAALMGFLPYNFYPAKIFLGDGGAYFLGFMMACITMMSFKSTAFITMLLPFALLFVPLMDSLIAIIRRKLSGQKITVADKHHLHHILMIDLNLGHRRTVMVLYTITIIFGATAFLYRYDSFFGAMVLVFLIILFEIFIEFTGMINPKYHPILSFFHWATKKKDE